MYNSLGRACTKQVTFLKPNRTKTELEKKSMVCVLSIISVLLVLCYKREHYIISSTLMFYPSKGTSVSDLVLTIGIIGIAFNQLLVSWVCKCGRKRRNRQECFT